MLSNNIITPEALLRLSAETRSPNISTLISTESEYSARDSSYPDVIAASLLLIWSSNQLKVIRKIRQNSSTVISIFNTKYSGLLLNYAF
jgi:hypothetical protein